jgi:hypothetical protein
LNNQIIQLSYKCDNGTWVGFNFSVSINPRIPTGTEIKIHGSSTLDGSFGAPGSASFYVRDEYNQTIDPALLAGYT